MLLLDVINVIFQPTLFALFSKFGPIHHFRYNKSCTAVTVGYKTKSSVEALLQTPMNSAYALPIPKASFSHVLTDSKKSWLKDPVSLKRQSEQYLQDYFKEKLREDESPEEDDEGWVSTKTKKRRIR
ncbi:unnamed protein product [Dibothriocephalus latus]|uniref:Uncharacterized protein n=1 Tax=Dibothriocephalus latus TaxID=60516 RepID=A0A3P7LC45_DIBLA|nr:unnamed protein product [Dibothriocephalus latus]